MSCMQCSLKVRVLSDRSSYDQYLHSNSFVILHFFNLVSGLQLHGICDTDAGCSSLRDDELLTLTNQLALTPYDRLQLELN
eukprot:6194650-Pleurochrysis_carterae.AAC.3